MEKVIPNLQLFSILILIGLLTILLDSFNLLFWPRKIAYFLTNPISFSLYQSQQKIGKQLHFIFAARNAAQENIALQKQMAEVLSENANLRRKLSEAEAQVVQQQHLDPQTYHLVATRPIGLDRYLRIDKGSDHGIKVGAAALFRDNYIGRVISVAPSVANIQLLSDPDSKVAAFSLNKDGKAKGILVGQFRVEMFFNKILHEEPITQGDLVYSEGTEGYLPRGLILGRVAEVLEKPNEVFKQAKISPVYDIRDLDLVFVMTD